MPDWKQRASAKSRVAENGEIPAHPLLRCKSQFGGGPFMKATSVIILAGALAMSGSALYAQGGAQASSSASSSTSVQADNPARLLPATPRHQPRRNPGIVQRRFPMARP